jgi:hypothetical protein
MRGLRQDRTLTVIKLTEALGLTAAGTKVFDDIARNEKREATTGEENKRLFASCEDIVKEDERSISPPVL